MRRATVLLACSCLTLLSPIGIARQSPAKDPAREKVTEMLRQARTEIGEFEKNGGKRDAPEHPVGRWVQQLWQIRSQHPNSPAASLATTEAVHLLVHADRYAEVQSRADSVPTADPAWETLPNVLFEAASNQKNYSYLIGKMRGLLSEPAEPKIQAAVHFNLGRGLWKAGDMESAKTALRRAVQVPGSAVAKEAESALYELENLGYGQPAPPFTAKTLAGGSLSLADFRGKVALIVFWSTT